jgi:signal peptidase I
MESANPHAPMPGSSASEPESRQPRWLALLLSLVTVPLAGSGLFLLRRSRRNWGWVAASAAMAGIYTLAAAVAPRLAVPAMIAMLLLGIAGIVVTGTAPADPFRGWGKTLLVAAGILVAGRAAAFGLRRAAVEAFQIPASSMVPTLVVGDHILVSRLQTTPSRGDVIVFRYPLDPHIDYVKRVMGLPGETLEIRKNQVLINGTALPRRQRDEPCAGECELWVEQAGDRTHLVRHARNRPPTDFGPRVIPAGEYFVIGDNRDESNDSRVWGTVAAPLIKGRASVIVWSSSSRARIGKPVE